MSSLHIKYLFCNILAFTLKMLSLMENSLSSCRCFIGTDLLQIVYPNTYVREAWVSHSLVMNEDLIVSIAVNQKENMSN
mgnify:CR=1 FL=1